MILEIKLLFVCAQSDQKKSATFGKMCHYRSIDPLNREQIAPSGHTACAADNGSSFEGEFEINQNGFCLQTLENVRRLENDIRKSFILKGVLGF